MEQNMRTSNVVEIKRAWSGKIQWHTIVAVTIFHVMAVWALFDFSWANLAAFGVLWWVSGSLGIGLGFHRLLTHRGFKSPRWFERFLTVCGTLALQSGPVSWVTTHRMHHAYTDTDRDPHSPKKGFFWAHMGWIFKGDAQIHSMDVHRRYSPDLLRDRFNIFMDKFYWLTPIAVGMVLLAVGGWSMLLWGIFLRTVVLWHFTWFVNSVTHVWGSRRFETRDTSTNNGLVAAVTFGEGWHNNHHAYPRSAKHGLRWYEIDVNWLQIKVLEKLGFVSEVYALDLSETKNEAVQMRKAA